MPLYDQSTSLVIYFKQDNGLFLFFHSGNYFQVGKQVKMELTVEEAYRRSIETLLDWAQKEVNSRKSLLALRTYAPVHFR